MQKQARHIELKVGALIVGALALLAGLVLALGNFALGDGFRISVDFEFTGNLHRGAPVKVSGIKVGKVEEIRFLGGRKDPQTGRRSYVRVELWIEDRVRGTIFSDAEIYINTQGVLGEQYVEIVPGVARKQPIRPGQILEGVTPPRTDLIVARLYEFLERATKLLRRDKDTISQLLRAGTSAVKGVDALLAANKKEINGLLHNANQLAAGATDLVKKVNAGVGDPRRLSRTIGHVERITGSASRKVDGLLANADRALAGVAQVTGAIGKPQQRDIQHTLDNVAKLSDRLYVVAGTARTLVGGLAKGKGTAGSLLVKHELYDDLKEMVRDLKRNPWKFLWRE